jgi:signal transduction histidine kinase/DNA-binding response OmpR family regulator
MAGIDLSKRRSTLLGILVVLALLIAGALAARQIARDAVDQRRWVEHSYQVLESLQQAEINAFEVIAERNLLLLSGQTDSPAFTTNLADLTGDADRLLTLTADNPTQRERAQAIHASVRDLVAHLRQSLTGVQLSEADRRQLILAASAQRTRLLDRIGLMASAERQVLADRTAEFEAASNNLFALLVVAFAVAGVFAALGLLLMRRNIQISRERIAELEAARARLDAGNAALRTGERRLQSVLDHATDAILLVAGDGQVRLANSAAETLFGLPAASIVGRPVSERIEGLSPEAREVTGIRADGSRFPGDISIGAGAGEQASDTVCILRDATERHRLAQLKTEFVSTVSHELRTPLTSIRGSLGLVVAGAAGPIPPKARQFLEIAHNNSARLVHLVNDILDIEKIESGRMEFRRERIEVGSLIQQAIEANQAYGEQHGVRFVNDAAGVDAGLEVMADMARLQQVMANLMSNAAKFSPAGSSVEVSQTMEGPMVRIAVRDHGGGIPAAFRDRIFQRFAQADSSDQRQKGGTGLGLSITKAIVEHHGGTIGFEDAPGGGTVFWFTLPRLAPRLAPLPLPNLPSGRRRILIVEDDPDVATLLSIMVERDGWTAAIAHSAAEADAWLERGSFDAMTLDVQLPDEDGLSLFRRLRARESTRDLPVVVVSAQVDRAHRLLNGDAIGVVDWLEKPIDQDRLRDAITRALRRRRATDGGMPRVLHVEDDRDILEVIRGVIGGEAEVTSAQNLAQAREALSREEFALVIIDVGLPDGSGLDLIDPIRQMADPPPIMIFSARDYDPSVASRVAASLVKSRTDNRVLGNVIQSLIGVDPPDTTAG